jgi:predicted Zn-dependent protease with MMP-like domain/Flp pilus assembly protein TadD
MDSTHDALLEEAATAFEEGDFGRARALTDQALSRQPRSARALHLRAACGLETGELDQGLADYRKARAAAPDDLEILIGLCDVLVCHRGEERELVEEGLGLCETGAKRAARADDVELQFEFLLLGGTGLNQLGECERALEVLDRAVALCPGSVEAALERGIALFELCRFDEAKAAFEEVLRRDPQDAWAHHHLGLLAERRKDAKDAKDARRCFERARQLQPEDFPPPVQLTDGDFDAAVEDAIRRLPEPVKAYLENATIAVEPIPADEDLVSADPPLSPTILGVFRGTPVGERSVTNAWDHAPCAIVLYQRNLERFARTRDELLEQIGITIMHEVGHLIGLDEHDLWMRGLE